MKHSPKVSMAIIRRLPRYYRMLTRLQAEGTERISSGALAQAMGLTASQIRSDLSQFGEFGQQGYGYQVNSLLEQIGEILGVDRGHTAVIVGAGNLGRALLNNFRFNRSGIEVLVAFDVSEQVVGTRIGGVEVLHTDQMETFLKEHPVDMGVLTVPIPAAQEMGDRLIAAGVQGIWNFTNQEITYDPESAIVESVHFSDSLLVLSYLIARREEDRKEDSYA